MYPEQVIGRVARRLPNFRGKTNLAWRWKRELELRRGPLHRSWSVELSGGTRYVLPGGSSMTWTLAWTGEWERHLREYVLGYVEPEGLLLDVGASLGLWTVPLGRAARDLGSEVWAFEPYPPNLEWLDGNISINGLTDVTTVKPFALGAEPGRARIAHAESGGGNAAITLEGEDLGTEVNVARLDDLELPAPVRFIKMDVEGFEVEVLEGARRVVESDRPVILGEFSQGWLTPRGQDPRELLEWLVSIDYEIATLDTVRDAWWKRRSLIRSRPLVPPFERLSEDLLLKPRTRRRRDW